ncbi:hypothetical protein Tdes44962_MAKER08018 [Teratosphaeria destructans]|uniref:DUF1857-domain-containing protein n=1 Tax=Teratosphaeria destructans TaxID=418781 RepID=A0A9W7W569_9PEZI|nr:hypothetical protein Tdes44962_MAKER08018 [Teratosphaeria destructans]
MFYRATAAKLSSKSRSDTCFGTDTCKPASNIVNVHCAYTEPINPPNASPVLTRDQIWKGLQRKVRRAQDFVPIIKACDVVEEKGNEVTRVAHFEQGGKKWEVKEVCKSYYPTMVDFHQPDGAVITNTVSDGPGLTENDYHMTYTFEWRDESIAEGSIEHKKFFEDKVQMAKMAVHSSIEALRKLAQAGDLE